MVAINEPAEDELTPDCLHGADHPGVSRGQKPDEWNHEQTRIQLDRIIRLSERAAFLTVAPRTHIVENLLTQGFPPVEIAGEIELLDRLHRAIERHPRHDLRVREMPAWPADLPNAFIGFAPVLFHKLDEMPLQVPRIRPGTDAHAPGEMHRVHDLAVDIELKLFGRRVSNAHRLGAFITG